LRRLLIPSRDEEVPMSSAVTEKAPKAQEAGSATSTAKPSGRRKTRASKGAGRSEGPAGSADESGAGEPGPGDGTGERERLDVAEGERRSIADLNAHELGLEGERIAASYLERRRYEIIETNWKARCGEVDIVARDGEEVVLVEVKTRVCMGGDAPEIPELAVDERKQRKYRSLALYYLAEHPEEDFVRFDVIAINIIGERLAKLRHLVGAFACDD
jgi:putative endonuclease